MTRETQAKSKPAATWEPIGSLTPWDRNPRRNAAAVDAVAKSIERFGFASPIVARQSDRVVIAGHTRLLAAQQLKLDKVPVRFLDIDPDEAAALALADNKTGEIAEWDDEALADLLREMDEESRQDLGWSNDELAALLADPEVEPTPEDDDAPEVQAEAVSVLGEVYELGPHRLMCGDSTTADAWKALLGDDRLQMVWTDPPYGVSYVGKTKDALTIENDEQDNDSLSLFLRDVFGMTVAHCAPGAAWHVAAPPGPRGIPFAVELMALGLFRQRLVWVKDAFVLGHSDYHYRHEDIYYGFAPGDGRRGRGGDGWFGDNAQDTVHECPRPKRSAEHPTMKPVELIRRHVENSSKPGWLIGDPFGGSGSTLIAAATTGRVARLIELDPRYCDVIRRRWTRWAKEHGRDPGAGALDG